MNECLISCKVTSDFLSYKASFAEAQFEYKTKQRIGFQVTHAYS